jgi:ubiquinone/menaquinone biosynthesis C-methylase UbiE
MQAPMQAVNYDDVAPVYDLRYERNRYDGVRAVLRRFLDGTLGGAVAEVGCGTGHWLADLRAGGFGPLAGLDRSRRMLERAHAAAPNALLVQGTADQLPWVDASFDRIFCVNALHHFPDQPGFISECRRVLRSGGGLLTIGLDPHCGDDEWWVYDFFAAALRADRLRYASTRTIRDWLTAVGFREAATEVAEHIGAAISFEAARKRGFLDRRATSQLMVISDDDYEAGISRLLSEQPVLRSNMRLYVTTAWA